MVIIEKYLVYLNEDNLSEFDWRELFRPPKYNIAGKSGDAVGRFARGLVGGVAGEPIQKLGGKVDDAIDAFNKWSEERKPDVEKINAAIETIAKHSPQIALALKILGVSIVAAIGLKVAFSIGGRISLLAANLNKCHRQCKGMNKRKAGDSLSHVCYLNCKIRTYQDLITNLNSVCARSKDPEKCKGKMSKKISSIEKEIAELQKKVSYYRV